jgi:zinc transport system substrate-binding protein
MTRLKEFFVTVAMVILVLLCPSCSKKTPAGGGQKKIAIVASLFPLYDFAKNVGQNKVDVSLLLPPGVEAHSFEPRPADIIKIGKADIFIYIGKFMEPWVDDILKSVTNKSLVVVDASTGINLITGQDQDEDEHEDSNIDTNSQKEKGHAQHHHHGGIDPHIWLDFSNGQKIVDNIAEALVKKDPANKDFYMKNAADYKGQLNTLDGEYKTVLSRCKYHTIIHGGHFAFGYMARRYNLKFIAAYQGFAPDTEPSPRNLAELIGTIRKEGVKYLFFEEFISPRVAKVLGEETGAGLLPLNGAHNVSKEQLEKGETFISIMKRNLESLKTGLGYQ